jgi:hypothetical protein
VAEPRPAAVVRLTLETPQTLGDLRKFMTQSVTLGMPENAAVECVSFPRQALVLSSRLDYLEEEI